MIPNAALENKNLVFLLVSNTLTFIMPVCLEHIDIYHIELEILNHVLKCQ
jgi:hypothetical protein